MTAAAIQAEGLHKRFVRRRSLRQNVRQPFAPADRITALEDVDLRVERGEVFGLLGPNGAGKTTLLKILACLVLPDAGRCTVHGHDVLADDRAVKRIIGYVTADERSFYWRLSARQNLIFFARLYGLPGARVAARVDGLLARMELSDRAGEPFSAFSSGMRQRLALARALLHDPPIMVLDEPTRSLDPLTAAHIRTFVRDDLAHTEGKTVLLATHNLHEAAAICDRMAVLARARVRQVGRLEDFRRLLKSARRYRLVTDQAVDLGELAIQRPASSPAPEAAVAVDIEPEDGADLAPVLRRLTATGVRVLELTRIEPTLEEVFAPLLDGERA